MAALIVISAYAIGICAVVLLLLMAIQQYSHKRELERIKKRAKEEFEEKYKHWISK